jgi:pimeloyl-ACP methyl ester carboxylesterase
MSFFGRLTGYDELWKAIIRPPREQYEVADLGPTEFVVGDAEFKRTDLELTNQRGHKLYCSHFEPSDEERPAQELPCVVMLHGNCSSRMDSLAAVPVLLPINVTVFCFDFSGSGKSEGEYISLGWFERDDVAVVVDHLRSSGRTSYIGLWGRSMGAATALLHAHRDPSIAGMVLDSPFASLYKLAEELGRQHSKLPKFMLKGGMSLVRKSIKKRAGFDIKKVNPIENVGEAFIPVQFVVAEEDNFIKPHHSEEIYQAYAGDKDIKRVEGDHNSMRPQYFLDSCGVFFYNVLQVETIPRAQRVFRALASEHSHMNEETFLRQAIIESLRTQNPEASDEEVSRLLEEAMRDS